MNLFYNTDEQRLRAGWRLLLQFIAMAIIISVAAIPFVYLLPTSLVLTSSAPMFIGVCASIWLAARYLDKRPIEQYGITFNRLWGKEFFIGVGIAAIAIGTVFLIEWWAGWLTITGYGWETPSEISFGWGFSTFFLAMLIVGFHEELFSRGYQILNITEGLRGQIGQRGALFIAVVLTSSLFGFLHFFNSHASAISTFNVTLAGVVLAIPYLLTGRLALSVGLHFSWNFMMAGVAGFPVSGRAIEFSVLQIQQNRTDLWTGGAFGPEAGLIGWLGMAIMLGGSCVYIKIEGDKLAVDELFKKKYQSFVKSDEQAL